MVTLETGTAMMSQPLQLQTYSQTVRRRRGFRSAPKALCSLAIGIPWNVLTTAPKLMSTPTRGLGSAKLPAPTHPTTSTPPLSSVSLSVLKAISLIPITVSASPTAPLAGSTTSPPICVSTPVLAPTTAMMTPPTATKSVLSSALLTSSLKETSANLAAPYPCTLTKPPTAVSATASTRLLLIAPRPVSRPAPSSRK